MTDDPRARSWFAVVGEEQPHVPAESADAARACGEVLTSLVSALHGGGEELASYAAVLVLPGHPDYDAWAVGTGLWQRESGSGVLLYGVEPASGAVMLMARIDVAPLLVGAAVRGMCDDDPPDVYPAAELPEPTPGVMRLYLVGSARHCTIAELTAQPVAGIGDA